MKAPFSAYPAGACGVGLLALRLSVSWSLLSLPAGDSLTRLPLVMLALCALFGFAVRVAATLGVMATISTMLSGGVSSTLALTSALDAAALVALGPGVFSIDSLRFGRRTVLLRFPDDPKV